MSTALSMPPLAEHLPAGTFDVDVSADGHPTIKVAAERLVDVCRALRDSPGLRFEVCVDLTAADYFPREPRYDVIYHLLSPELKLRLRLRVQVGGEAPEVPTLTGVWKSTNWQEREVLDLFGIVFTGHPDPRRLIMPEDWEGHPLRKDFPVQVNLPVRTFSPLQLTEEEFQANMEADRVLRPRR